MLTIADCSLKGGTGKTTVAAALGVWIAEVCNSGRVALIDLDEGQASLTAWWHKRNVHQGKQESPWLLQNLTDLPRNLAALKKDGWTHTIIDCGPHDVQLTEMA